MTPQERRAIVVTLLDNWTYLFEPSSSTGLANASTSRTSDGWVGPKISGLAGDTTVIELRRCVELCRSMAPNHYKHLLGYYGSDTRLVDKPCKRRDHRGRMVDSIERVRERVVPRWVTMRLVERAVDFLCCCFNGEPKLPKAFTRKLRALADSDGWTEAA